MGRMLVLLGAISAAACTSSAPGAVAAVEGPRADTHVAEGPPTRAISVGRRSVDRATVGPRLAPPGAKTQGVRRVDPGADVTREPRAVARLDD